MTSFEDHIGYIFTKVYDAWGKEDKVFSQDQFLEVVESEPLKRYEFKSDAFSDARIKLCHAIVAYRAAKGITNTIIKEPNFKEIKKEVETIAKLATSLSIRLQKISSQALSALLWADRIADKELISRSCDPSLPGIFGHPIYIRKSENGGDEISTWTIHNIIKMIDVFSNMSEFTLRNMRPTMSLGRPRDEATNMFVLNIRPVWESICNERFSVRQHKGEPTSPAAIFCWKILKIADPHASFSSLDTAMRASAHRSGTGRGRPSAKNKRK